MVHVVDARPLLLAGLMTALLLAWVTVAGSDGGSLQAPAINFGSGPAGAAGDAASSYVLPEYAAHLRACEPTSGLPRCPTTALQARTLVGLVSPGFGADGRLESGAVDRFDVAGPPRAITARLEGDQGAVLGVYARGRPLVDPADGLRQVVGVAVPEGVSVVQILVVNRADTTREYRLSLD